MFCTGGLRLGLRAEDSRTKLDYVSCFEENWGTSGIMPLRSCGIEFLLGFPAFPIFEDNHLCPRAKYCYHIHRPLTLNPRSYTLSTKAFLGKGARTAKSEV